MQSLRRISMQAAVALVLCAGLCGARALTAADAPSVSEQINQTSLKFEQQQDRDFKGVAESLDRWRKTKFRAAVKELSDLFDKAAPADKAFIAYQVLSVDPRNKAARALFSAAGTATPFDEKGQRVPDVKAPTCNNRQVVEKVASLKYPAFSEVAEVVSRKSPTVQSYWKRQQSGLDDLRKQLIAFAEKDKTEAATSYQALAFYWPGCKEVAGYYNTVGKPVPRQRTWFPSLDRYLLDHELAGVDCLDTRIFKPSSGAEPVMGDKGQPATLNGDASWDFMENLRNCRVEAVISSRAPLTFTVVDAAGKGASLLIKNTQLELGQFDGGTPTKLGEVTIEQDVAANPVPVAFEVRGRKLAALVGGVVVASAELSGDHAYKRFQVTARGASAQQLRVRFLADRIESPDELLAAADPPKPDPAKPAEEPWRAERLKQFDKPITFKFEDTSVEEVAALFSRLGGVAISFDSKADTLKNLPVTLSGTDMKLSSALDWLQRVSDLSYVPTAEGVRLTWNK